MLSTPSAEAARDVALLAWTLAKLQLAHGGVLRSISELSLRHIEARSSGPQAGSRSQRRRRSWIWVRFGWILFDFIASRAMF